MEGALAARTEGKLPVRVLDAADDLIGTFQTVKITSAADLSLTGELIEA
jgi:tRNA A37 methylthiotransferase MiaB